MLVQVPKTHTLSTYYWILCNLQDASNDENNTVKTFHWFNIYSRIYLIMHT
jgi:hypothetical protein